MKFCAANFEHWEMHGNATLEHVWYSVFGCLKPDYAIKHGIGFHQNSWNKLGWFPTPQPSQGSTRTFSILWGSWVSTEFCCGLRRTDSELGFCIGAEIPTSMMGAGETDTDGDDSSFRQIFPPGWNVKHLNNTPLCLTNQPSFQVQIFASPNIISAISAGHVSLSSGAKPSKTPQLVCLRSGDITPVIRIHMVSPVLMIQNSMYIISHSYLIHLSPGVWCSFEFCVCFPNDSQFLSIMQHHDESVSNSHELCWHTFRFLYKWFVRTRKWRPNRPISP